MEIRHQQNLAALLIALASATLITMTSCSAKNDAVSQAEKTEKDRPSIAETKAIAEEGFIYGLPIVMNYAVMNEYAVNKDSGQFKAPFNEINNQHRVYTYKDTAIIAANSDTPYSGGFLDLRNEPIVLSVPAVDKGRYYSVMLTDGNTFNYGYIGSRATGNEPGDYLVAGPDWKGETPSGIKQVFHSGTQFSMMAFRTQLFGAADMPNVVKIQNGYHAQPLSAYLHQPAPPPARATDFLPASIAGIKDNFWAYLDFALQFNPPGPEEVEIRAKLARIGIGAGKTFDFKDLDAEHKAEVVLGMEDGHKKVEQAVANLGTSVHGWRVSSSYGDRAFYHGDWLLRAAAATAGIYANDVVEAIYPFAKVDVNGDPLDASKHDYTLTFAANQFPPVNAFWSVTMYDGKTQLLIKNPINRYLINSPMLPGLKKNGDGSLTIYIQKDSPGRNKESNWLPAPDGPIYLMMRLYWPKTAPPSILPAGQGTWQPPGVVQVK
jgi:hypothetical protein